jgi:hypothetical protein
MGRRVAMRRAGIRPPGLYGPGGGAPGGGPPGYGGAPGSPGPGMPPDPRTFPATLNGLASALLLVAACRGTPAGDSRDAVAAAAGPSLSSSVAAAAAIAGPASAQQPQDLAGAGRAGVPAGFNYEGTYRTGRNEIKLLRVDATRAKCDVYAERALDHNSGFATGDATVDKDRATYSDTSMGHCTIRMDFAPGGKLKVTQPGEDSDCGFGFGVRADGTYTRVSSARPTIGVDPRIGPSVAQTGTLGGSPGQPAAAPPGGNGGVALSSADLRRAVAPASAAVADADVKRRYGQYPSDAFQKVPGVKAAMGRADPVFFVPPGDLPVPNGPMLDNHAVRLGAREVLLLSGCRLMNQCDTTWYVVAYDALSRSAALVEETETAGKYTLQGNPEPVLRALLLSFAAHEMHP